MKIGVLTYHRAHNYGAVFQAYALKVFLNRNGYEDVSFVDYWPEYHDNVYKLFDRDLYASSKIINKLKYVIRCLLRYTRYRRRYNAFNDFIIKYIVPKTDYKNDSYDVVIYGSDQIWRCQNLKGCNGFDTIYLGSDVIKAKKRIAYSASIGDISQVEEFKSLFVSYINEFSAISVREYDLFKSLSLSFNSISCTLDPIFLLSASEWSALINGGKKNKKKYILVYNLQSVVLVESIALQIAQKTGLPIFHLTNKVKHNFRPKGYLDDAGPEDFFSLVKNASYVVTSSFHGTAFALLFNKELYVSMANNITRVSSLLNLVGLSSRFINDNNFVFDLHDRIAWEKVNNVLHCHILDSQSFLLNSIK